MLKLISRFFQKKCMVEGQCSICRLYGILKYTVFFIPIRGQCQHLNKHYQGKPCFKLGKRWLWISYFLAFLLTAACFIQFREASTKLKCSEDLTSKIDGLIAVEELFYFLFFLIIYLMALLTCRGRLAFLNAVVDLVDNEYYIRIFGSPWTHGPDLKFGMGQIMSTVAFVMADCLLAIVYQQSNSLFVNLCFVLTILLLTTMGIQVLREIGILIKYRRRIDKLLENRLNSIKGTNGVYELEIEGDTRNVEFEEQLKATELYYSEFYTCIEDHLNGFMGPLFIFWCLSSLIMLVLDFYMMVLLIEKGMWYKNLVDELRTYAHIFAVIFLMNKGTYIASTSDDALSFLFKYPISKLSEREAYQVEMLIYTLSTQKPTIKASDIFTVGTKLLASISGTVVTYVLVALQFRPAWRD